MKYIKLLTCILLTSFSFNLPAHKYEDNTYKLLEVLKIEESM